MPTAAVFIGYAAVALLAGGAAVASAEQQRKARSQAIDAAKERQREAEELAKHDKTMQQEAEAVGKLKLGDTETDRKKRRKKGKAALKIESVRRDPEERPQIATGVAAPKAEQTRIQI